MHSGTSYFELRHINGKKKAEEDGKKKKEEGGALDLKEGGRSKKRSGHRYGLGLGLLGPQSWAWIESLGLVLGLGYGVWLLGLFFHPLSWAWIGFGSPSRTGAFIQAEPVSVCKSSIPNLASLVG